MEQEMLTRIGSLLEQAEVRTAEFRKDTYESSFRDHLERNQELFRQLAELYVSEDRSEQEKNCEEFARAFADKAQEVCGRETRRAKRDRARLNLNLYMVSYFLPALVEYDREYVGSKGQVKALTDAVCGEWEKRRELGHIETADYETIKGGFRNKLCFVTTAVCMGLKKPQDCPELAMMKRYRDEYLIKQTDGEALVKEYYDIAPTIVKRIARTEHAEDVYRYLWEHYLCECLALLESGKPKECGELYKQMMFSLKQQYLITQRKQEKHEQTV